MSMLADSRRRKRYNLQPRGKPLYESENHFGKKILEKMGWSIGKGLGAKENGIKEFVKVHYKNDAQGLGYVERDDQWTQHDEHFTGLLKVLNEENDRASQDNDIPKNGEEYERDSNWNDIMANVTRGFGFKSFQGEDRTSANDSVQNESKQEEFKKQISGISLEEVSKQSKVRVHYKKFTKGKDLTQYSEKDLANIFGKKGKEFRDNIKSIEMKSSNQSSKGYNSNLNGSIQTITAPLPINEYFNEKMVRKLKNNKDVVDYNQTQSNELSIETEMNQNNGDAAATNNMININETKKKKKKWIIEASTNNCCSNLSLSVSTNIKELGENAKLHEFESIDSHLSNINHHHESSDQMNKKNKSKKRKYSKNNDKEEYATEEGNAFVATTETKEESIPINKEKKPSKKNKENTKNHIPHSIDDNDGKENNSKTQNLLDDANVYAEDDVDQNKNKHKLKIRETNKVDNTEKFLEKQKTKNKNKEKWPLETELKNSELIKLYTNVELIKEKLPPTSKQKLEESTESLANVKNNTKKRKINNTKDLNNVLEVKVGEGEKEHLLSCSNSETKKKEKVHNEEVNHDLSITSSTTNGMCEQISSKDLSDDNNHSITTSPSLSLEELTAQYDKFNQYTISSFCAEKFRNVDAEQFPGASLIKLNGYALNDETMLNVEYIQNDDERITNLWKCILDKYEGLEKPKKTYRMYMKEVHKARIHKQKKPKLHVKTWKRRNGFRAL